MKTQLSILTALVALSATPAFAEDSKTLGGSACAPADGVWTGIQPSAGRMYTSTDAQLECPVEKDSMGSGLVDDTAMVHVIDNSTTSDASCTLRTKSMSTTSATVGSWANTASTTGNSSFMRTLELKGTMGGDTESATTSVWYYLVCDIPASGYLVSYYWAEN